MLAWGFALVLCAATLADRDPAFAQAGGQAANSENMSLQIESVGRAAALIERLATADAVGDQTLANARVKLDGLDRELQTFKAAIAQRLSEINARFTMDWTTGMSARPERA